MGRNISSYDLTPQPELSDKVIGTRQATGGTFNFSIEQILSLSGTSSEINKSQLADLIAASGLTTASFYRISDATSSPESIILQAASTNTLSEICIRVSDITELYSYNVSGDTLEVYASSFPEAPEDGKEYARKNADWSEVTGFPEAPENGKTFGRKDAAWEEVVVDIAQIELLPNTGQGGTWFEGSLPFDNVGGYVTGSSTTPTSIATFDVKTTGAIFGVVNQIYYQGDLIPSFTSETVINFSPDNFVSNELCLLTIILQANGEYVLYISSPSDGIVTTVINSNSVYEISNADRGKIFEFDNAGATTNIALPTGILSGTTIGIVNNTGGSLTFSAEVGVTIVAEGLNLETAATAATILCWGSDRFQIIGKLS